MKYQLFNSQAAQEVLQVRLKALSEYRECSKMTHTRLKAMERLKFSNSIDHSTVNDAINDLKEARANEAESKQKFDKINSGIKKDICEEFPNDVSQDIQKALADHVKAQIRLHKRELAIFEGLRPYTADLGSPTNISTVSINFSLSEANDSDTS